MRYPPPTQPRAPQILLKKNRDYGGPGNEEMYFYFIFINCSRQLLSRMMLTIEYNCIIKNDKNCRLIVTQIPLDVIFVLYNHHQLPHNILNQMFFRQGQMMTTDSQNESWFMPITSDSIIDTCEVPVRPPPPPP